VGIILKVLGFVDVIAAAVLLLPLAVPTRIILILSAGLVIKGISFGSDPVSRLDILIGLYVALSVVFEISLINILLGIYLGIKGVLSLF